MSLLHALNYFCDLICLEHCRICELDCNPARSGQGVRAICNNCWGSFNKDEHISQWRGLPNGKALQIVSCLYFKNEVKTIIYKLKYKGDKLLALDLSSLMQEKMHKLAISQPITLIPVPLHKQRQVSRGFNQSELIATKLARLSGAKVDIQAIVRIKQTLPQHGLGKAERLKNLQGAFDGNSKRLRDKNIVLIDDVHTSGATLVEAANEIVSCGAASVAALTVACAPLYDL